MIQGITIKLDVKTQTGTDSFGNPTYSTTQVDVKNVLVSPVSNDDMLSELNLTGKKSVYELAIPKGDTHVWKNTTVEFFGKKWKTIGIPVGGIEAMIPLDWNAKIKVEEYE